MHNHILNYSAVKNSNLWLIMFINLCVREFTVSLTVQHTKPKVPEGKQKHFV